MSDFTNKMHMAVQGLPKATIVPSKSKVPGPVGRATIVPSKSKVLGQGGKAKTPGQPAPSVPGGLQRAVTPGGIPKVPGMGGPGKPKMPGMGGIGKPKVPSLPRRRSNPYVIWPKE